MIMLLLHYLLFSVTLKTCLTLGNLEDIEQCIGENNNPVYFQYLELNIINIFAPHLLRKITTFCKRDTCLL